jgi:hypothetical protein
MIIKKIATPSGRHYAAFVRRLLWPLFPAVYETYVLDRNTGRKRISQSSSKQEALEDMDLLISDLDRYQQKGVKP